MTAEQLQHLVNQAQRLTSWLARDLAGWAPVGADVGKLRRIYDKAERRLERRRAALQARLRQAEMRRYHSALMERLNLMG